MSAPLAVDWGRGVSDAWSSIARFVPRLVGFLAIALAGWLLVRVAMRIVKAGLGRVGFDRAVERGGIGRLLARSGYDASAVLGRLIQATLLLFVAQLAFGVFGPNPVSDLIRGVVAFLPRIAVAVVVVVVGAALAAAARSFLSGVLAGLSYGPLVGTLAAVLIMIGFVKAALDEVQVATSVTTPILYALLATLVGIAVVGVGGGLIRPMERRWEDVLYRGERELGPARAAWRANRGARERAWTAPAPSNGAVGPAQEETNGLIPDEYEASVRIIPPRRD